MVRLVLPAVLVLSACSGSKPDAGVVGCETDPAAQTYAAGMKQSGDGNKLAFVLVSSDPGLRCAAPTPGR